MLRLRGVLQTTGRQLLHVSVLCVVHSGSELLQLSAAELQPQNRLTPLATDGFASLPGVLDNRVTVFFLTAKDT